MWALENFPFYADKFTTAPTAGLHQRSESDENCHTFDADRNVIPACMLAARRAGQPFCHRSTHRPEGRQPSMAMYYSVAGKNAFRRSGPEAAIKNHSPPGAVFFLPAPGFLRPM